MPQQLASPWQIDRLCRQGWPQADSVARVEDLDHHAATEDGEVSLGGHHLCRVVDGRRHHRDLLLDGHHESAALEREHLARRGARALGKDHFTNEMAQDLRELNYLPHLSMETLQLICGLVVKVMLSAVADILDLRPNQPRVEAQLLDGFVRQLRLIFLGASVWREDHGSGRTGSRSSATPDT